MYIYLQLLTKLNIYRESFYSFTVDSFNFIQYHMFSILAYIFFFFCINFYNASRCCSQFLKQSEQDGMFVCLLCNNCPSATSVYIFIKLRFN